MLVRCKMCKYIEILTSSIAQGEKEGCKCSSHQGLRPWLGCFERLRRFNSYYHTYNSLNLS